MNKIMSKLFGGALALTVTAAAVSVMPQAAYAKELEYIPTATTYLFDADSKYVIDEASETNPSGITALGTVSVTGNAENNGTEGDYDKINVSNGNLKISYQFDTSSLPTDESSWYLISDKSETINGYDLSGDIKKGTVLIETSYDGEKWIKSGEVQDYFSAEQTAPVYTTSDLQLLNGCYFRITVAYKEEQVVGSKKIAFVSTDEKETRKIAEVYQFYAVNEKAKASDGSSASDKPRKEYDDKDLVVAAGTDTLGMESDYSKSSSIGSKDVHYGWSIGTFTVNGYTQTQEKSDGTTVFLKNVGDKVTLWFTLNQDINKLNGKDTLSINEDKNGSDSKLQTAKTNLGRGALFIQYTDCEGHKTTVPYVDYLAACSTTSADTRVVLYEEGDYEIVLDYEIKSTPRKVGSVEVVPDLTNYRTSFKFSVHNSNAMLYPFDVTTGSELINQAITPNGFRIDLANSKDLKVYVTRANITTNSSGKHVEDIRADKAANDGDTFTDEGKYTLKVQNTYTNEEMEKTIYVGSDPFLIAMASTGLTVDDLDAALSSGYTLSDDGSLVASAQTSADVERMVTEATDAVAAQQQADLAELNGEDPTAVTTDEASEDSTGASAFPIILVVIIAIVIAIVAVIAVVVLKSMSGSKNVANASGSQRRTLPNRNANVRDNPIVDVPAFDVTDDMSDENSWDDDSEYDEDGEY